MGNVLTMATQKTAKMMMNANDRLDKMGEMPYGKRKATPEERKMQKAMAEEAEMQELLNG